MATIDPSLIRNISIDNTLGATLVGFACSCCVFGVLLSQLFSYFMRYPSDKLLYKFLVCLIGVLSTADQTMIGHLVYHYTISNFANLVAVLRAEVTWSFILQETIGAIVGAIVKTMFVLRVWRFSSRNYWITGILMILTYVHLGLAMAFAVKAFALPSVFSVVELRVLGTVSLATDVVADISIAGVLCFYLNRLRTGYKQSDTLVNSLVRYAISTGLFTSAVSLTCLVLYNLMPHNLIFISVYFTLSKLYAISFMATLNTRRVVRGKGTDRQGTTSHTGPMSTNMFALGTRVPTVYVQEEDSNGWANSKDAFPLTSFTPSMPSPESMYSGSGNGKYIPPVHYGNAV